MEEKSEYVVLATGPIEGNTQLAGDRLSLTHQVAEPYLTAGKLIPYVPPPTPVRELKPSTQDLSGEIAELHAHADRCTDAVVAELGHAIAESQKQIIAEMEKQSNASALAKLQKQCEDNATEIAALKKSVDTLTSKLKV